MTISQLKKKNYEIYCLGVENRKKQCWLNSTENSILNWFSWGASEEEYEFWGYLHWNGITDYFKKKYPSYFIKKNFYINVLPI